MKPLLLSLMLASPAFAQQIISPEVQGDGRVTFRLMAPKAGDVQLHCEGVDDTAMRKDDQGVWSTTTDPLQPDIYVYSFSVEGVHVVDPNNPLLKYNLLNTESRLPSG